VKRLLRVCGKLAGVAAALTIAGATVGCSAPAGSAAGRVQPPVPPGENTAAPDMSGVQLPDFVMPQIKGAVSRPNPELTPGSVVITNTNTVCSLSTHGDLHPMSPATQQAVYQAYGYTTASEQHKQDLNYLVPLDLGGGTGTDNIWPAALRGAGFDQKVQTDHVLRDLVCRRALSLTEAQHDEETDWYAAWLRYVVATGSA
jgi:hypothetical protein